MTVPLNMPHYRCSKVVQALKIGTIGRGRVRPEVAPPMPAFYNQLTITPADPAFPAFQPGDDWFVRFHGDEHAIDGVSDTGYFVLYEDGYTSWSPTVAFENGYSAIQETET